MRCPNGCQLTFNGPKDHLYRVYGDNGLWTVCPVCKGKGEVSKKDLTTQTGKRIVSMTVAEMASMGGKASAAALTPKQRRERAAMGGKATKDIPKRVRCPNGCQESSVNHEYRVYADGGKGRMDWIKCPVCDGRGKVPKKRKAKS